MCVREGAEREKQTDRQTGREADALLGVEPDTANPRTLRPKPEQKIKRWRLNQLSYPGVLHPGYLTLKTKTFANGN